MRSTRVNTEYKESLGIFAATSSHITLIADAIKEHVLPRLGQSDSKIDVGAGVGAITKKLRPYFREVTVLDSNPEVKNDLSEDDYHIEICNFLEFDTDNKYDFVLCSHVLYFFDEIKMQAFIEKLLSLVKEGGYCFITLIAPRGENHQFHNEYDSTYINSHKVIEILQKLEIPFDKIEAKPHHFTTSNPYEIKNLLKFCLMANCPSSSNITQIDALVEQQADKCKGTDGIYDFQQEDDYIMVPRSK